MEHYNIEQAIVDAKERANIAAQEATMPAGLAEEKFHLAAELRKQATEATNKALEIQRDAIEAARRAMEIQKQRCVHDMNSCFVMRCQSLQFYARV